MFTVLGYHTQNLQFLQSVLFLLIFSCLLFLQCLFVSSPIFPAFSLMSIFPLLWIKTVASFANFPTISISTYCSLLSFLFTRSFFISFPRLFSLKFHPCLLDCAFYFWFIQICQHFNKFLMDVSLSCPRHHYGLEYADPIPCGRVRPPHLSWKGVLGMILNWIWWYFFTKS